MTEVPSSSEPPMILVADDDTEIRDLVAEVLSEAGFRTIAASDGEEVVGLARDHQPALIVLDLMMPRMDGYTVLARLRGHPATREIPVIMLTGHAEPIYRTLSAGVGAVVHLTKPFLPRVLAQTVRRVVAAHTT